MIVHQKIVIKWTILNFKPIIIQCLFISFDQFFLYFDMLIRAYFPSMYIASLWARLSDYAKSYLLLRQCLFSKYSTIFLLKYAHKSCQELKKRLQYQIIMLGAVPIAMVASPHLWVRTCHDVSTFSFMQPTEHAVSTLATLHYTGKKKGR